MSKERNKTGLFWSLVLVAGIVIGWLACYFGNNYQIAKDEDVKTIADAIRGSEGPAKAVAVSEQEQNADSVPATVAVKPPTKQASPAQRAASTSTKAKYASAQPQASTNKSASSKPAAKPVAKDPYNVSIVPPAPRREIIPRGSWVPPGNYVYKKTSWGITKKKTLEVKLHQFVYSPWVLDVAVPLLDRIVDPQGAAPGTKVKCPHTDLIFMIPEMQ